MMDLTPDQTDAILRDHNAPGAVRASVLADYEVTRYLDTVEFYEDNDGVTHTRPKPDPTSEPDSVPAAVEPAPAPVEPTPAVTPDTTPSPATADAPVAPVEPDNDDTTTPSA